MTQTTSENAEVRYKIGDVCRIADVQPYVLRYWESEFPLLAPDRSLAGPRTYSARELELIGQIKRLLYDEGYTIAGAKKRLESEAAGARSHDTNPAFIPADAGKSEKSEKDEKSEKAPEKSGEKTVRPPIVRRPSSKAAAPVFVETSPASAQTEVGEATFPVDPAKGAAAQTPDPRVAHAVRELKEILALLSQD
ncbi:MAG TPA: MerR family transcriptional regulator [Thermoanaerobaculia bacterium]